MEVIIVNNGEIINTFNTLTVGVVDTPNFGRVLNPKALTAAQWVQAGCMVVIQPDLNKYQVKSDIIINGDTAYREALYDEVNFNVADEKAAIKLRYLKMAIQARFDLFFGTETKPIAAIDDLLSDGIISQTNIDAYNTIKQAYIAKVAEINACTTLAELLAF